MRASIESLLPIIRFFERLKHYNLHADNIKYMFQGNRMLLHLNMCPFFGSISVDLRYACFFSQLQIDVACRMGLITCLVGIGCGLILFLLCFDFHLASREQLEER